ncbi:MAG: exo-alpha-sialidase, partial [Lachnospiraceae bacterium]|nr:exo-alpha-sialidase [Lachnospiraceae bacterium]
MRKRELGTVAAEFIPSKEKRNPRNSEGAFIKLHDGTVFFAYSRFKGEGCEDWGISDICAV